MQEDPETKALLNSLAEMSAKQSEALERLTRPYVVVDIRPRQFVNMLYFRLKNAGRTPAHEVRMAIDPPIALRDRRSDEINAFERALPVLAPLDEIWFFFDSAVDLFNREDAPLDFQIHLCYRDADDQQYDETTRIDVEWFKGLALEIPIEDRLLTQIEKIEKHLGRLAHYVDGIRMHEMTAWAQSQDREREQEK